MAPMARRGRGWAGLLAGAQRPGESPVLAKVLGGCGHAVPAGLRDPVRRPGSAHALIGRWPQRTTAACVGGAGAAAGGVGVAPDWFMDCGQPQRLGTRQVVRGELLNGIGAPSGRWPPVGGRASGCPPTLALRDGGLEAAFHGGRATCRVPRFSAPSCGDMQTACASAAWRWAFTPACRSSG